VQLHHAIGVTIPEIKFHGMLVVPWNLIPILVTSCSPKRSKVGLINHPLELLFTSCNAFEPLPSVQIKKIVVSGIYGTCHRIISCNNGKRYRGNLPILPFNHDIVLGSLIILVMLSEWSLVCSDTPKLPYIALPIFLSLKRIKKFLVGDDVLKLVIVDRTYKLNTI
jgi:hypothetical protein